MPDVQEPDQPEESAIKIRVPNEYVDIGEELANDEYSDDTGQAIFEDIQNADSFQLED